MNWLSDILLRLLKTSRYPCVLKMCNSSGYLHHCLQDERPTTQHAAWDVVILSHSCLLLSGEDVFCTFTSLLYVISSQPCISWSHYNSCVINAAVYIIKTIVYSYRALFIVVCLYRSHVHCRISCAREIRFSVKWWS